MRVSNRFPCSVFIFSSMIRPTPNQLWGDASKHRKGHHSSLASMVGLGDAQSLDHIFRVRIDPAGLGPCVQIFTSIYDLSPQLVERRTHVFVTPLRELVAIANNVQFRIAKDVVSIDFKKVGHCGCSFRCLRLQQMSAVNLFRKAVPDLEIGDP